MKFSTFKTPLLTVDGLIINDNDEFILIKRKNPPFKYKWALPGGFVEYGETVEGALFREIKEETGLTIKILSIIGIFSKPNRDPRGHTVTIAYLTKAIGGCLKASDDAADIILTKSIKKRELAFDHYEIIKTGLKIFKKLKSNK